MEILQMRFHGRNKQSPKISASLIAISRDLLVEHAFDEKLRRQDNHDLNLAELTRICLTGEEGIATATQISRKLARAIMKKQVLASDYPRLLDSIAKTQPRVFLDVFLGGDTIDSRQRRRRFGYQLERYGDPLAQISDDELLSWCEADPTYGIQQLHPRFLPSRKPLKQTTSNGKISYLRSSRGHQIWNLFSNISQQE